MKLSKICFFAIASAFAFGAFADAANLLISFSTKAPDPATGYPGDTYVDGTPVLDGEWYALVWWPAEGEKTSFGGITPDCKPAREGDVVVIVAPLAVNHHCDVIFEVESESGLKRSDGHYEVLLLDTRDETLQHPSVVDAKTGKPKFLNASQVSADLLASKAVGGSVSVVAAMDKVPDWVESVIPESEGQPKIDALDIGAEYVSLKVSGMVPGAKYNVKSGCDVNHLDNFALEYPQSSDKAMFSIDKKLYNFFQIVRQPFGAKLDK